MPVEKARLAIEKRHEARYLLREHLIDVATSLVKGFKSLADVASLQTAAQDLVARMDVTSTLFRIQDLLAAYPMQWGDDPKGEPTKPKHRS